MRTLALIMAGGQGTRLYPLTRDRAKPAVPFGGKYRIVDFVLSNMVNSQIYSIYLLVQCRSQSLIEHLKDGWQFGRILHDHFIVPVPAQMRLGEMVPGHGRRDFSEHESDRRFQARSDCGVRRRPHLPDGYPADDRVSHGPQGGGDSGDAAGGGGGGESVRGSGSRFGVAGFGFDEKPANPRAMPGAPGCLASMGNYLFDPQVLRTALIEDAQNTAVIMISAAT